MVLVRLIVEVRVVEDGSGGSGEGVGESGR